MTGCLHTSLLTPCKKNLVTIDELCNVTIKDQANS